MVPESMFGLDPVSLGQLMPMHVWISPTGHIRDAGPTLLKILSGDRLVGRRFLEVFALRRPRECFSLGDFLNLIGRRLSLALRDPPHTAFKGIAVALGAGQGVLLNLSFGIEVAAAVRDHKLTNGDFAPTDLTIEMLYLTEAKTAVMEELRKLNKRLHGAKLAAEEQAMTDTLTGLRNRRAMDRTLEWVIEAKVPFGLMHLDLDYFKQVNDTLGHAAGDLVLEVVAGALRSETRESDTVARVGGDEFVIIFPELVDPARLAAIGQRILSRLEEPIGFEGKVARISASIGTTISTFYTPVQPDRILSDADQALYASKRNGRCRVTAWSPDLAAGGAVDGPLTEERAGV